jgi:hypothetical protein
MKWIGAHIWDWVTRFRSDIYIDNISETEQDHVIGIDSSGKLTKFDTPTGSGGGDENLDEGFSVTNQDPGFSHVYGDPYTTSTSYTAVLKALLNPYNLTTIKLDAISIEREISASVYDSTIYTYNGNGVLEVGQKFRAKAIKYTVADPTQTNDTSVNFLLDTTTVESGFSDTVTTLQDLDATAIGLATVDHSPVVSENGDPFVFKITVADDGGGASVLRSDTITMTVQNRVKVGGHPEEGPLGASESQDVYDNTTTAYDSLSAKSNITISANAAMENTSNYTWIMYPSSWGELQNVYLLPGTSLGVGGSGAFGSKQTVYIVNDFSRAVEYNFHRSTGKGAYDSSQHQIQLKF